MTKIILDTNIIIKQPKILGLQIPNTTFLIPNDVIEELNLRANNRGASFDSRISLIEKASKKGTVSIVNTNNPIYDVHKNSVNTNRLTRADLGILSVAIELANKGEAVRISTLDKEIIKLAISRKIGVLSEIDIDTLIFTFEHRSENKESIQNDIIVYEKNEKNNLWKGIMIGFLAAIIAVLFNNNIEKIISTINIWGTITLIILLGIGLFIFREKRRLSYGVFEFFVGVVVIIMLFLPNDFDFSKLSFDVDFNIKLLGGLYIMVRGQDNIVKALRDTKVGLFLKEGYGIGV